VIRQKSATELLGRDHEKQSTEKTCRAGELSRKIVLGESNSGGKRNFPQRIAFASKTGLTGGGGGGGGGGGCWGGLLGGGEGGGGGGELTGKEPKEKRDQRLQPLSGEDPP